MIPVNDDTFTPEFEEVELPTYTYKLDLQKKTIKSYTDEVEAMKQAVYKILTTERYKHEIYSWNYGVELDDLIGQPPQYVCPELERRITEALLQDERITSITDFSFTIDKDTIITLFTVNTVFGDFDYNFKMEI